MTCVHYEVACSIERYGLNTSLYKCTNLILTLYIL